MKVTDFGATVKGDETKLYTLTNKNGMEIAVSSYGATAGTGDRTGQRRQPV